MSKLNGKNDQLGLERDWKRMKRRYPGKCWQDRGSYFNLTVGTLRKGGKSRSLDRTLADVGLKVMDFRKESLVNVQEEWSNCWEVAVKRYSLNLRKELFGWHFPNW